MREVNKSKCYVLGDYIMWLGSDNGVGLYSIGIAGMTTLTHQGAQIFT